MDLDKKELDRYITGNYGEDQFKFGFDIPILYCTCHDDIEIGLKKDEKNELLFNGKCNNCKSTWQVIRRLS